MNAFLLLVVGTIAVMVWWYRYRPLGADDLGCVSERWLQEYRNGTHESH